MSYTNQTTTTVADLISKLNTFLSGTPGWTTHHSAANGEFAARKTGSGFDIGFASQWSTATPNALGIYQWYNAAYNSGASPWAQTNDSGGGAASTSNATLLTARRTLIGPSNNPLQFWCFEDDHYFHVVVQFSATTYTHFGAGKIDKFNDWTGGEYVYGDLLGSLVNGNGSIVDASQTVLLHGGLRNSGGFTTANGFAATMHIEGMDNQVAGGLYGVCMGNQASGSLGNDRQAAPKARLHILGGYGGGPLARVYSQYRGTLARAMNPLWPIVQFYWNRTTDNVYPLGMMRDVRGVNIRDFEPGQEITIGGDVWVMFPQVKPTSDTVPLGSPGQTGFQGIAYKKVTT